MLNFLVLTSLGFLLCTSPAYAGWGLYGTDGLNIVDRQLTSNLISERITQDMLDRTARETGPSREDRNRSDRSYSRSSASRSLAAEPTRFQAPGDARIAAKLAGSYPNENRHEVERAFSDLLLRFGEIERQFGSPRNDLPTAVAGLIAASYMVYHDTEFPDRQFKSLIEQMRAIMGSSKELLAAPPGLRRDMYEEMAILAMFMAGVQMEARRASAPASAALKQRMRMTAQGYLEQLLGVDARNVQITATGLSLK